MRTSGFKFDAPTPAGVSAHQVARQSVRSDCICSFAGVGFGTLPSFATQSLKYA
jgi:hypothetical protein